MVSEITNITTADLQGGLSFTEAYESFTEWCGDEFVFLVWGIDDLDMLCDNMQLHGIDTSSVATTYNLQRAFDVQIAKENRQISLARAMEMLNEPALRFHDALNDAMNTARVCSYLDMEKGLADCEIKRKLKKCKPRKKPKEKKKPDRLYPTRRHALKDPEINKFFYPDFNEEIICSGFVEQSYRKYLASGIGDSGRELLVKFYFKKWDDGKFSVSRSACEMTEERKASYNKRKKHAKKAKAKYYGKNKKGK